MNDPDPVDELIAAIRNRRDYGTTLMSRIGLVPGHAALAGDRLDELEVRLAHADALYPGIASAVGRDASAAVRTHVAELDAERERAEQHASHAEHTADRRLGAAAALYERMVRAESLTRSFDSLRQSDTRLRAYVAELEATLGRVAPRAPQLIAACAGRAAKSLGESETEPF